MSMIFTLDSGKVGKYTKRIEMRMMRLGQILLDGQGLGQVHPEDLLGQLPFPRPSLRTSESSLLGQGRVSRPTRSGIFLVVKRSGGWRGLLAI